MTEHDWLTTQTVSDLTHHKSSRSQRKRRLLAVAAVQRVSHYLPTSDPDWLETIDTVERFADGQAGWDDVVRQRRIIMKLRRNNSSAQEPTQSAMSATINLTDKEPWMAVHAMENARMAAGAARPDFTLGCEQENAFQLALARDVFANPFRAVRWHAEWLSAPVRELAEAIYAQRHFQSMPVLADALEEAGCDEPEILDHCRADMTHVRGCWVIDRILGKE